MFSIAALEVSDGKQKAQVRISIAGGSVEANVNRWRDQLALPRLSREAFNELVRPIVVDGVKGHYVDVANPKADDPMRARLLGVIVETKAGTHFFTMRGPIDLLEKEKANFESFVTSVRFARKEKPKEDDRDEASDEGKASLAGAQPEKKVREAKDGPASPPIPQDPYHKTRDGKSGVEGSFWYQYLPGVPGAMIPPAQPRSGVHLTVYKVEKGKPGDVVAKGKFDHAYKFVLEPGAYVLEITRAKKGDGGTQSITIKKGMMLQLKIIDIVPGV